MGLFPDGASPYGVLDLSGNVGEWCLTEYSQPEPRLEDENLRSRNVRVVRGGSWFDNRGFARADECYLRNPSDCYDYLGFRLARS